MQESVNKNKCNGWSCHLVILGVLGDSQHQLLHQLTYTTTFHLTVNIAGNRRCGTVN